MKIKLSGLAIGTCFIQGRKRRLKKKTSEDQASEVKKGGRVSTRKVKGDPDVSPVTCPLKLLGVGLRRHPDQIVEIGDGNITRPRRKQ